MITSSLTTSTTINHPNYIGYELSKYGIDYERYNIDDSNISEFMVVDGNKHISFDVFTSDHPINVNLHYHNDDEARLIISGWGTFEIMIDDRIATLVVTAGDYISIPAGIIHTFKSTEPIKTIRYFVNNNPYTAIYTDST